MVDIHSHVLHNLDDGSPTVEVSLKALQKAVDAGVTDLFFTPHFLRGHYDNTRDIIDNRFDELAKAAKAKKLNIRLHKGVEMHLNDKSPDDIQNNSLQMGNSKYVLVETDINAVPVNLHDIIYKLVTMGYRPIMAHPERYVPYIKKLSLIEDLIFRNVYMQVNAGSLLGQYGKNIQKWSWKLLEKGMAHFVASDFHCGNSDYPLKHAYEAVKETFDQYTADLLFIENPQKVLANEKIDFFYVKLVKEKPLPWYKEIFNRLWKKEY